MTIQKTAASDKVGYKIVIYEQETTPIAIKRVFQNALSECYWVNHLKKQHDNCWPNTNETIDDDILDLLNKFLIL